MDLTPISVILAVLSLIVGYLQLRKMHSSKKRRKTEIHKVSLLKQILEKKSITIACFNYPPFVKYNIETNEEPTGYYPAIFKEIARKNNLEIDWKCISIADSVESINNQEADIILSLFQTPNRSKHVDFCCLHHSVKVGGVSRRSLRGITSLSDLINSGLKVVVGRNEVGHEIIQGMGIAKNRLIIIDNEEVAKIVSFVETGHADIAILDSVSIKNFFEKYYKKNGSTLKPIFQKSPLYMCTNGIMIPKDEQEFEKWIEKEVYILRKTNDIKEIEKDFLEEYSSIINRR